MWRYYSLYAVLVAVLCHAALLLIVRRIDPFLLFSAAYWHIAGLAIPAVIIAGILLLAFTHRSSYVSAGAACLAVVLLSYFQHCFIVAAAASV